MKTRIIHLGQKILHFDVPKGLVEEINGVYEEKFSELKSYNCDMKR